MRSEERRREQTYLPDDAATETVAAFVRQFERFANRQATLISASGDEVALPGQLFDVLALVSTELAAGRGVTVMPRDMRLTTQQAADLLSISRPTLIRLLEDGRMPFELIGRHRRILLQDVQQYQDQVRAERRALLDRMALEGQRDGLHALAGSLPRADPPEH